MLQPRTYPELIGKALVFEADPFVVMVDDDDPWIEGLFLIICVGLLVGGARFIGGLLMWASLPPGDALLETILQGLRQVVPALSSVTTDALLTEEAIRQVWNATSSFYGYGSFWLRLFAIVGIPVLLIAQWVIMGGISHGVAKLMGGQGTLNQTLGATALMVAPQIFYVLGIIPFVSISGLLLGTWAVLITYRAVEVAHELPWQRAAVAAVAAPAIFLLVTLGGFLTISLLLFLGGLA